MKTLILAFLVFNSVSVLAAELGEKEKTTCTAGTQTDRSKGLKKDEKRTDVPSAEIVIKQR